MSNEITTSSLLQCKNGFYTDQFQVSGSTQFSQNNQGSSAGILNLTTAAQAIPLGSIATGGWFAFRNLGTVATGALSCQLGTVATGGSFNSFASLAPGGEWIVGRVDPLARLYAKVPLTGSQKLQYLVLES